jgi:hypothetical protein
MKKAQSKLTKPRANPVQPPRDLEPPGRALWLAILHEYEIDDSGSRALLAEACRAFDRAEQCAKAIARDGLMIAARNGFKEHPLLRVELASRSFATKTLLRIGVVEVPADKPVGRPPRGGLGILETREDWRANGDDA